MHVPSSGNSSRSIGAGSSSNSFSGRVFDGRSSVGRSSDSGPSILRSFGSESTGRSVQGNLSNGGDSDSTRSNFRWSFPGIASRDGSVDRNSGRLRNDLNNSPQFSGSLKDARRSETTTGPSDANAPARSDNSNPFSGGFSRSQRQTATSQLPIDGSRTGKADSRASGQSPGDQVRSRDTTTRLTNDKLRDFLQLRRDNAVEQAGGVGDDAPNRRFGRNPGTANVGSNARGGIGQFNLRDQINDSKKAGDQAWTKRFGGPNGAPSDRLQKGAAATSRGGNGIQHAGNAIIQGGKRAGNDRKLDRALIDRTYQGWRKNALGGERGSAADHRDWSGRWKDGERFLAAHEIRDHWKSHGDRETLPFRDGWWKNHREHGGRWDHWDGFADHHHHPFFWWSWCPAPRLTTWITFGWAEPCYWDYGPGEYINCYDGVIYVNGVWFEPAPAYYRRTLLIAQRVPVWTPQQAAQIEWLPLGVFVVARDGVADNNVLIQLAVTRDGVIGGTIFNQLTGATFPIEGMVDRQTQRAAWTYVDDTGARIVMESSIYNLTQPEATGLIHFSPDNIQLIELVRLEQPSVGL